MTLSEQINPWHRPGLEAAGVEDEWTDTRPAEELPVQDPPSQARCRHGRRECYTCDRGEVCRWHGFDFCTCKQAEVPS